MEYLLKVSTVLAIFYFCYKLFLQHDTFFNHNRWFLLVGLISSFIVPFYVLKEYIEYTPNAINNFNFNEVVEENIVQPFSIVNYIPITYLLGILIFSFRFLLQITSLLGLIFNNKSCKKGIFTFIETNKKVSPFSFFNWIVYNPNQFTKDEFELIITHEKTHVKQYHSLDVLFTQIACILLWFNPIIWLYNKDLKQNLEFIADCSAINFLGCKKAYQYILLKTSLPTHQFALSNNFYNSLIKKRIVMLHKSKSKKINQFKFTLVIPLLALFLMSFNTKTIYIEKEINSYDLLKKNVIETPEIKETISKNSLLNSRVKKQQTITNDFVSATINKETREASLNKIVKTFEENGVTLKFRGIRRNNIGEIVAIKIEDISKKSNANFNISSDQTIKPISIMFDKKNDSVSIGNTTTKHKLNSFTFKSDDNDTVHKIHNLSKNYSTIFI